MKLFLKIILLVTVALLFIQGAILLTLPYLHEDEYYVYQYKKSFLQENTTNDSSYDHVIFGDCIALTAVNPRYLDGQSLNLSFAGGTPIEIYYSIKKYLRHNKKPKKISLILSSNQFLGLDFFFENALGLKMLNKTELNEVQQNFDKYRFNYPGPFVFKNLESGTINKLISLFPNSISMNLDFIASRLSLNPAYFTKLKRCLFSFCFTKDRFDYYSFTKENHGFYQYNITAKKDVYEYYIDWQDFQVPPVIHYYFEKILQLTKEENISVVYQHPPITQTNRNAVSQRHLDQIISYLEQIQSKYPHIKVHQKIMVYPDDHFSTSIYPNNKGAEKFSRYLNELP